MSNDLEKELRDALRPVDPDEGFTLRVMARIEEEESRSKRWWPPLQVRWLPVALAASALVGAVLMDVWHDRQQQGLEARQQLIQALRVTGEKLDLAYRGVNADTGA